MRELCTYQCICIVVCLHKRFPDNPEGKFVVTRNLSPKTKQMCKKRARKSSSTSVHFTMSSTADNIVFSVRSKFLLDKYPVLNNGQSWKLRQKHKPEQTYGASIHSLSVIYNLNNAVRQRDHHAQAALKVSSEEWGTRETIVQVSPRFCLASSTFWLKSFESALWFSMLTSKAAKNRSTPH